MIIIIIYDSSYFIKSSRHFEKSTLLSFPECVDFEDFSTFTALIRPERSVSSIFW